jgi:hypothetical protein
MAKQDAKDDLSIKVSHADMLAYTDQLYTDIADPAINGINTHAADESPHNLPARFAAVQGQIDTINDELATKLGAGDVSLDGKADVAGDTFTGTVTFAGGDEAVIITGPEQTDRSIRGKTAGLNRWEIAVASNDDEQGANSGSNLVVARYNDDGTFKGIPFAIDRATGVTYIDQLSVGGGDLLVGEGMDVRVQPDEPTTDLKVGTVWLRPCGTTGGGALPNIPTYGLLAHIAATSVVDPIDNMTVTSIPDLSAANNPASAVGSPKYRVGKTPNGGPAIRGGNPGYLTLPQTLFSGKTAGHLFVYYAKVEAGEKSGPWQMGSGRTQHWDNSIEDGGLRTSVSTYTPSPNPNMAWRILEVSNTSGYTRNYLDGTLQAQGSATFSGPTTPYLLRSIENVGAGSGFYIADFIAYDRRLSDAEAADVRAALIAKNGPVGPITDPHVTAHLVTTPWAYYPLSQGVSGGFANDFSGNDRHASLLNAASTNLTSGYDYNTVAGFPSTGQIAYATAQNGGLRPPGSFAGNTGFTMSAWINGNPGSGNDYYALQWKFGSTMLRLYEVISAHTSLTSGTVVANSGSFNAATTVKHYAWRGEWISGVNDVCRFSFYLNGVRTGNVIDLPGTIVGAPIEFALTSWNAPLETRYAQHLGIWDRPLSEAEILAIASTRP